MRLRKALDLLVLEIFFVCEGSSTGIAGSAPLNLAPFALWTGSSDEKVYFTTQQEIYKSLYIKSLAIVTIIFPMENTLC